MMGAFEGCFNGLRVLVTGHTGFKGSWLSVWLRELGATVIGYALNPPTEPSNFDFCRLSGRIIDVRGDIRDAEHVRRTMEKHAPEVVIHMAAQSLVRRAYESPKDTFDVNVTGTVNVLEAVRQSGAVRVFIGVTTDKVYEDRGWLWSYRESDVLGGYDPYSASKAMAELAIQSYRRSWSESGFSQRPVSIASVRAGNVIGGGDWTCHGLIADAMRDLMAGRPIRLHTPASVRPWLFVLDALSGYLWLAARLHKEGPAFAEAWNFGPFDQNLVTCRMIAQTASSLWGGKGIVEDQPGNNAPPHQSEILTLSSDKSVRRLRWRPVYGWAEAVAAAVDWFKIYHEISREGEPADMYEVCARHVRAYTDRAHNLGVAWASTSPNHLEGLPECCA